MAKFCNRSASVRVVAGWMMALFTTLFASAPVHAYIGPGAGLSAIGSVLALVGAVLLMILGFVWYPVKRMLKRKKTEPAPDEVSAETPEINDLQQQHLPNHSQSDKS